MSRAYVFKEGLQMNVNDVVLYCIIIASALLVVLEFLAHKHQKLMHHQLYGSKERLSKLSRLVEEIEGVEKQMHVAATEKVDRRNLDLIMRETIDFLGEKRTS
ncbi:MAG: hypothetical protein AABX01_00430 [Candidatus Micrarchaeota archaeon]